MRKPIESIVNHYRGVLSDCGFTAKEAELIAKVRAKSNAEPGRITAQKTADGTAEIAVYDYIGFDLWTMTGCTPQWLVDQLESMKPYNRIVCRINSPGGSVFDATTMFNILRRQEVPVAVEIEGIAASAASYLSQVADAGQLRISEAGQMMIHCASGGFYAEGNAEDMEAAAEDLLGLVEVLRKIDGQIASIYAGRSGRKADTFLAMMRSESYFTGAEAVSAKLADEVISTKRPKNEAPKNETPAFADKSKRARAVALELEVA